MDGLAICGHALHEAFPSGHGDRFASREAWKVQYQSQRAAWHDTPFERLNRLQRELGCREGYDEYIYRPKGMWRRNFERPLTDYEAISDQCDMI